MRFFTLPIFFVAVLVTSSPSLAAPAISTPLAIQAQNLVALLSDGNAVGYPQAMLIQKTKIGSNQELTLTVLTLEGFGGGNNWAQYLAAFSQETTEKGKSHYMLIDVMRIGGGAWRAVQTLNARVTATSQSNEAIIVIDTLANTDDDPPNFPSKKATLKLLLKNGRFSEQ